MAPPPQSRRIVARQQTAPLSGVKEPFGPSLSRRVRILYEPHRMPIGPLLDAEPTSSGVRLGRALGVVVHDAGREEQLENFVREIGVLPWLDAP